MAGLEWKVLFYYDGLAHGHSQHDLILHTLQLISLCNTTNNKPQTLRLQLFSKLRTNCFW